MKLRTAQWLTAAVCVIGGASAFAQQVGTSRGFKAIYVFGDSLADTGNLPSLFPFVPPYDPHRACNGKLFVDFLAEFYGIAPVAPSTAGGTNYAWGGATATPGLEFVPGTSGIDQAQQYLDGVGGIADNKGVYIVEFGLNDLFARLLGGADPHAAAIDTAANVEILLRMLVSAGARHVWVVQPARRNDPIDRLLDTVIPGFSATLQSTIEQYDAELARVVDAIGHDDVRTADFGEIEDGIRAHPDAYGFADVTHACITQWPVPWWTPGITACSEPNTYLYWDSSHRTEQAHRVYAAFLATSRRNRAGRGEQDTHGDHAQADLR